MSFTYVVVLIRYMEIVGAGERCQSTRCKPRYIRKGKAVNDGVGTWATLMDAGGIDRTVRQPWHKSTKWGSISGDGGEVHVVVVSARCAGGIGSRVVRCVRFES